MNDLNPIDQSSRATPLRHIQSQEERIDNFFGHAVSFISSLKNQNMMLSRDEKIRVSITDVYAEAEKEIKTLQEQIKAAYGNKPLSKKEIKNLGVELKKQQAVIAAIALRAQSEVRKIRAGEIAQPHENLDKNLSRLIKGGLGAVWVRFLALLPGTESHKAVKALEGADYNMVEASKVRIDPKEKESRAEKGRRREFDEYRTGSGKIAHRKGVIRVNSEFRFVPVLKKKKMTGQFKQFIQQRLSDKERKPIEKELAFTGGATGDIRLNTEFVPMNRHMDEALHLDSDYFGNLFGQEGTSSADRTEKTPVNVYTTGISNGEKLLYSGIRHAVISPIYESDPKKRADLSKSAAKEIVSAAVLQHLSDKGISLGDIDSNSPPIEMTITSMSLLTPDSLRGLKSKAIDERAMLRDQVQALRSFERAKFLRIGDKKIRVKLRIQTFNYGVNAGAVSAITAGNRRQNRINQPGLIDFRRDLNDFRKKLGPALIEASNDIRYNEHENEVKFLYGALDDLESDILALSEHRKTYVRGDNQFELGAKILTATHLMDRLSVIANPMIADDRVKLPGHKGMFNCKSGKDRTGVMNDFLFTLGTMAEINGKYPTRDELKNNAAVRDQFTEILIGMLLKSGSLEITEINTDGLGYKIDDICRIVGLSKPEFEKHFRIAQGMSKTVGS